MKNILIGIFLAVCSFSALALNLQPSANAESEFYPAATNCSMGSSTKTPSKIPIAYSYGGALQVWEGFMLNCSLPIKPGKYVERIVFDFYANGMEPRSCIVGFVRALSGGTVSNHMTQARDGNVDVWYYDNLGSIEAYTGGNPGSALYLACGHWNFTGTSWMRYGVIRVDYSPE